MKEPELLDLTNANALKYTVRPYRLTDRSGVRLIFGEDEFARPDLLNKYPDMGQYLADEGSCYYTDYEPESLLVAEAQEEMVGALLGAVSTDRYKEIYKRHIGRLLIRRCLSGAYGFPGWLIPIVRTELACRNLVTPVVDFHQYPAHLHIGVLADCRRKGIGTALMERYADYLCQIKVPGYHLYASSFHPMGVAFYRKLGLEDLGHFKWPFHDGYQWSTVTEYIFGKRLGESSRRRISDELISADQHYRRAP